MYTYLFEINIAFSKPCNFTHLVHLLDRNNVESSTWDTLCMYYSLFAWKRNVCHENQLTHKWSAIIVIVESNYKPTDCFSISRRRRTGMRRHYRLSTQKSPEDVRYYSNWTWTNGVCFAIEFLQQDIYKNDSYIKEIYIWMKVGVKAFTVFINYILLQEISRISTACKNWVKCYNEK